MKFDSLVARATTLAITSMISSMAEDYANDQDMDSYWTCLAALSRITKETGHNGFHKLPDETRAKVLAEAIQMLGGAGDPVDLPTADIGVPEL